MYVYTCICMYVIICRCIPVYVCGVCRCTCAYLYSCEFMFSVACCSVSNSPVRSELGNRRFEFIPVVDPIDWKFEDRLMGWFGDLYWFVLWIPDGDSILKLHHFMWVLSFMYFSYLPLSVGVHMLLVSSHVIFCYILPVWLPISLQEASVSIHFNYVVDLSDYLRHFMYNGLPLWLWTSVGYLTLRLAFVIVPLMISDSISLVFSI